MTMCTSTMNYNLLNILTVMMLVEGTKLLDRQHLNVLSSESNSQNSSPLGLYTVM